MIVYLLVRNNETLVEELKKLDNIGFLGTDQRPRELYSHMLVSQPN